MWLTCQLLKLFIQLWFLNGGKYIFYIIIYRLSLNCFVAENENLRKFCSSFAERKDRKSVCFLNFSRGLALCKIEVNQACNNRDHSGHKDRTFLHRIFLKRKPLGSLLPSDKSEQYSFFSFIKLTPAVHVFFCQFLSYPPFVCLNERRHFF